MYDEAAKFYDLIHDAKGRDAPAEADLVIGELRRRNSGTHSVLDVACGTGAHLPQFAEFFDVAGFDASDEMLSFAAVRCPSANLVKADMRDFDLGATFDAVVCLFSGIGYLTTEADLRVAVAHMAAHLNPGGVLIIEGWVEPEYWLGTTFNAECARDRDHAVGRVVRSSRDGMLRDVFMRYTVASAHAMTTIDEHHRVRLSDPVEFESAYRAARLTYERLPHMLHPGRAIHAGTLTN